MAKLSEPHDVLVYLIIKAPGSIGNIRQQKMNSHSTLNRSAAKTYVDYVSGPVKIKDGLYMGDESAAKDIDFIVSNKVTHIVNTVVKRVPNLYERYGVQYLSVNWTEKEQNIFDKRYNAVNMILAFIEEAMEQGQSVLVHSLHGKSRSGCVIIAYLMKKHCWTLQKSMDFITSKKDSFQIKNLFMSQLRELEKSIQQTSQLHSDWDTHHTGDDIVVNNTYKNRKAVALVQKQQLVKKSKKKVSWGDKTTIPAEHRAPGHNILTSASKYRQFMEGSGLLPLNPILKNINLINDAIMDSGDQNISINLESLQMESITLQDQAKGVSDKQNLPNNPDRLSKSQRLTSQTMTNNFVTNQKMKSERYASIQQKQAKSRQRKLESKSGSRLAPYENIISSIKSPYDIDFISRIGDQSKKRNEGRNYQKVTHGQERGQSVNLQEQQRENLSKVNFARLNVKQQATGEVRVRNNWGVAQGNTRYL